MKTHWQMQEKHVAQLGLPEFGLACLKLNTTLFVSSASLLLAESFFNMHLHRIGILLLLGIVAIWMLETFFRSISRFFQPARLRLLLPPAGFSCVLRPFLSTSQWVAVRKPIQTEVPYIALSEMWFLPTLRKLVFPFFLLSALLLWVSTVLHVIPNGQVGLKSVFGRLGNQSLGAGLHLTLPYPFAEVVVVPRDRLQSLVLGMNADTGKPILWDREHYVGEENQLVGNGNDLLTISVPIYYYLRDPVAYYKHTVNAKKTVRDIAQRELLVLTLHRSAFNIMTLDRQSLEQELKDGLQAELDKRETGIAIAMVCLRDIHPPVQVAPAFQEVISALEEKEETIHVGEAYQADNIPKAQSTAAQVKSQADTALATRLAFVGGQTASFIRLQKSYAEAPEVFRVRQSYAAFDASLRGVRKVIMDEQYRGKIPAVVDTRKTLNPDFNPLPSPESPSLIPSLGDKMSDFDRAIDGYLKMDQGALPAPPTYQPDADHPLVEKP